MLNLLSSGHFSDMRDISSLQGLMNGNNKDSMTTTVSYKLNLRGPGVTVQTACSTSLAAVHVACRGLLNHEADMAWRAASGSICCMTAAIITSPARSSRLTAIAVPLTPRRRGP